jgi:hypothetical protein
MPKIGPIFVVGAVLVVVATGRASAQGSDTGPGNPTLLKAIQNLQNSVNTLQNTVNSLNATVNNIATNGVPPTPRLFYLTKETHQGNTALLACVSGFHMASLWELFDPSNLQYDTSLGRTAADSGQGPPDGELGWIRTGAASSIGDPNGKDPAGAAGVANCSAWTSNSDAADGTFAGLVQTWFFSVATRTDPWFGSTAHCSFTKAVWCVADSK